MCTYSTYSLLQQFVCALLHTLFMVKDVMCTYRTHSLLQKLCARTAHTIYGKRYVHIPQYSLLQRLWARTAHALYGKICYVHVLHILIIAKDVMCTYRTYSLLQKVMCTAAHALYGKGCYVHIPHIFVIAKVMCTYCTYSLWQALCAHTAIFIVAKIIRTIRTQSLCQSYVYVLHMRTGDYLQVLSSLSTVCSVFYVYKSHSVSTWWVPLDKGSALTWPLHNTHKARGTDMHSPLSSIHKHDPSVREAERRTRLESWFIYLRRISSACMYIKKLYELRKRRCHEDLRKSGGVSLLTLNLTLHGFQDSASHPGRFNPRSSVSVPTNMTSGGPHRRFGPFGQELNLFPLSWMEPWSLG